MNFIDVDALKADFMRISRCADTVEGLACAMEDSINNAHVITCRECDGDIIDFNGRLIGHINLEDMGGHND